MPLTKVFSRPQNWSRLKTLLLKHYYRRQGLSLLAYLERFSPPGSVCQAARNKPHFSMILLDSTRDSSKESKEDRDGEGDLPRVEARPKCHHGITATIASDS